MNGQKNNTRRNQHRVKLNRTKRLAAKIRGATNCEPNIFNMATKLKKTVRRETDDFQKFGKYRGRPYIISIEPPYVVRVQIKGTRQAVTTTVQEIYSMAERNGLALKYREAMSEYNAKKKAGYKRLRKPRKPIFL